MEKINDKNEEIVNTQLNQAIEGLANILVYIIEENFSNNGSILNHKNKQNDNYEKEKTK